MNKTSRGQPDHLVTNRKAQDRAFILTLIGLLLLVPPIADVFQIDARIAGVPFTALYLFVVWGVLIVGAAALSKRLRDADETTSPPPVIVQSAGTPSVALTSNVLDDHSSLTRTQD
jgi:hypothetical protein